ncbi:MAG: SPOR domain-containing protein [Bacteroidales bacterium]|nr:SPOR domain-containing protein [Bacteroidales bacterium]
MTLYKYIRELLLLEDIVIIPGFGGFVSHYTSAEIQEESQTLVPPSKSIEFDAEMLADDGILVSYISIQMDRPKDVISEMLADQVREMHEFMAKDEKIYMSGIGYFVSGKDGELVFKANLNANFLLDSFGLSSFSFPVLELEKQSIFNRSLFFRQPDSSQSESLPGSISSSTKKDKTKQNVAFAIAAVVLLSLFPLNSRISESIFRHPSAFGPMPSLVVLDSPVKLKVASTELIDTYTSEEASAIKFLIIAGSFISEQNADVLYQDLISRGYQAKIEQARKSFYRVIMAEYISLDKAELALLDLQAVNQDLSLWILK